VEGLEQSVAYWNGNQKANAYAGQHREAGLAVVLIGEDVRILQCSKGANDGELSATQDGIGIEVAHVGRFPAFIVLLMEEERPSGY